MYYFVYYSVIPFTWDQYNVLKFKKKLSFLSLNGYPLGQDKSEFIIVSHKNEYRCVYAGMYLIREEDLRQPMGVTYDFYYKWGSLFKWP